MEKVLLILLNEKNTSIIKESKNKVDYCDETGCCINKEIKIIINNLLIINYNKP